MLSTKSQKNRPNQPADMSFQAGLVSQSWRLESNFFHKIPISLTFDPAMKTLKTTSLDASRAEVL